MRTFFWWIGLSFRFIVFLIIAAIGTIIAVFNYESAEDVWDAAINILTGDLWNER